MSFLVDTNVISELRKGARANPRVAAWFADLAEEEVYLSVLTVGEIRNGIERIRRRDRRAATALDRWLRTLVRDYEDRVLPVDRAVAEQWGRLSVPDPLPVIDALLAATAAVHGLVLATRNVKHLERIEVPLFDPFRP
ncbi:MAG: type II toxin-antitoxin system VapC family toxin [Acidobacteria bacterium]|nr:type II toxin-antitoxin system VapC family toxin [Acidobacteriota bacterium]